MNAASPAKRLEELAAAAVIGAERAGAAPRKMLAEAAAAATRARAGLRPRTRIQAPVPCEEEDRPPCRAPAASILARLVADADWTLVGEWAGLAGAHGVRAPEGLVPALLEACVTRRELAARMRPVLGKRADWLAAMNPAWRTAAVRRLPEDLDARWSTATSQERREWITEIRRTEPARAHGLLRSTWAQDAAGERQRLLVALREGLSAADEDFLEECLKDRSKGVRQEAAALLARLAGSRYVARMTDRAAALITVAEAKGGLLRKKGVKLTVEPPKDWDPAFEADGLEEKPAGSIGRRAWWLTQIVACVPPTEWTRLTGLTPADLVTALRDNDYEAAVLDGWANAAAKHADTEWSLVLLDQRVNHPKRRLEHAPVFLWADLPAEPCERVVRHMMMPGRVPWEVKWHALGTVTHPWSQTFSQDVLASLHQAHRTKKSEWWEIGDAIERVVVHAHTSVASSLEDVIVKAFGGDLPPSVEKALGRLRLRAEMHKEFAS